MTVENANQYRCQLTITIIFLHLSRHNGKNMAEKNKR